jgi:monoamine oxidase
VHQFLSKIEPVFPGTTAQYNGLAYEDHWHLDPWHLGGYSYWRIGQYTGPNGGFSFYEGVQEGRCHFAGEHTSGDNQGFLEGAVETGERAAREINAQV